MYFLDILVVDHIRRKKKRKKEKEDAISKSSALTEHTFDQGAMSSIFCGSLSITFAGRISEVHEKTFI